MGKSKFRFKVQIVMLKELFLWSSRMVSMSNILVTDVNGTRANNVAQFARVESGNQFALTAESRKELVGETDHLSGFHVTGESRRKIQELVGY